MAEPNFANALVFTGGGTGGHFFPAVALAEGAGRRWPDRAIGFVGAQRGIEAGKLAGSPWPHLLLDVEGFHGRSVFRALRSLWKLFHATRRMKRVYAAGRPWAVVGTGGYAAAPALLAARSLGIPYFLHESNAAPGTLVKLLSAKAQRVWCGMKEAEALLPGASCLTVGTPVRAAFLRDFEPTERQGPPYQFLVMGGSGGARAINAVLADLAGALLEAHPDWEILHQTGSGGLAGEAPQNLHRRHRLVAFIDNVDQALEAASLVLCRAGAVTCAELRACGRPAVLVPLPNSAGDHQVLNALAMAREGRAVVVEQGEGFAERLRSVLEKLLSSEAERGAHSRPEPNAAVTKCLDDLAARLS
jgi:UDP-N-acetylglucosamine--N-acetylmuramyl-(pentapeptide) pyrophosphoryl-undecaprenol N-acetylglucosamine transferase